MPCAQGFGSLLWLLLLLLPSHVTQTSACSSSSYSRLTTIAEYKYHSSSIGWSVCLSVYLSAGRLVTHGRSVGRSFVGRSVTRRQQQQGSVGLLGMPVSVSYRGCLESDGTTGAVWCCAVLRGSMWCSAVWCHGCHVVLVLRCAVR